MQIGRARAWPVGGGLERRGAVSPTWMQIGRVRAWPVGGGLERRGAVSPI